MYLSLNNTLHHILYQKFKKMCYLYAVVASGVRLWWRGHRILRYPDHPPPVCYTGPHTPPQRSRSQTRSRGPLQWRLVRLPSVCTGLLIHCCKNKVPRSSNTNEVHWSSIPLGSQVRSRTVKKMSRSFSNLHYF